MSTSKTLSNGTLSLRFMQRAKDTKGTVQLDKAEVKDDGEWEVSREIREAWGLVGKAGDNGSGGATGEGVDKVHEASYLPFLFGKDEADDDEGWGTKTKGRRVFNNKGEDISFKTTVVQPVASTSNANITSLSNSAPPSKPLKTFERPSSISSTPKTYGKKKQSARDAIFGNGDVGVDLRAQKRSGNEAEDTPAPAAPTPSTGFMKPAGVDEPNKPSTTDNDDIGSGIINGARAPVKRRVEEDGDVEKKKRRKKKNTAA